VPFKAPSAGLRCSILFLPQVEQDGNNHQNQDVGESKSPVIFCMGDSLPFKVKVVTHVNQRQAYQTTYNKIFQNEFF
jgi:hypothetical protein